MTERRRLEHRTHDALDALLAMAEALVGREQPEAAPDSPSGDAPSGAPSVSGRLAELTRQVLACRHVAIIALDPGTEGLRPVAVAGFSGEDEQRWWRQWERHPALGDRLDDASIARLRADDALVLGRTRPPFSSDTAFGRRLVLMVPLKLGGQLTGVLSVDHANARHDYTPDEVTLVRAVGRLAALVTERERLLREREEARATELALREANRRMDAFLGIAGHEMRTPLTTVKGNMQLAGRRLDRLIERAGASTTDASDLGAVRDVLARTDAQVNRLTRLIEDLLDVSRIHAGHLQIRPEPCDLAAIIREVVQEQRQLAPAHAVRLDLPDADTETATDTGAAAVPVTADCDRIAQVVTNYLSNALKYSPPEQAVTVGVRVDGAVARVWVRDAGPGLPPDEQERVWDRFYRVESISHQYGSSIGLGLGLHISRTIVERHGGQVGVESVPGAGSTFWFTLPLTP